MALYSLYADIDNYSLIRFDREELREKFGANPKSHIDTGFKPVVFNDKWKRVSVTFEDGDGMIGSAIPDIMEFKAKLFLNPKAYQSLHHLLKGYGEFLPVSYQGAECFIFNPLSVAEDYDAVNETLCTKDEWGDITSMAFYEEKLAAVPIFKSAINKYQSLNCNDVLKQAIEENDLKGVYFTRDLGCPHSAKISAHLKTN